MLEQNCIFYVGAITRHCNAHRSKLGDTGTEKLCAFHPSSPYTKFKEVHTDSTSAVSRARSMFFLQDLKETPYWNTGHRNPQIYYWVRICCVDISYCHKLISLTHKIKYWPYRYNPYWVFLTLHGFWNKPIKCLCISTHASQTFTHHRP